MSSASPQETSSPPPASSWATPPEFYLDENTVTRQVLRLLRGLGYRVHTPAELQGSRVEAQGVDDEVWLPQVGRRGWAVIGTDAHIFDRPEEYEAFLVAKVAVYLLPGQSRRDERVELVSHNLTYMCGQASQFAASVWMLTMQGPEPFEAAAGLSYTQRRRRAGLAKKAKKKR